MDDQVSRPPAIVRDVTLREFGQNVTREGLSVFTPDARLWLAHRLIDVGFRSFEVASTASPKVVPAMADDQLRPFLEKLGSPPGVELVTLVPPNEKSFERFFDLGLARLGHTMGAFVSAMDEHNMANLHCTVEESLNVLERVVPTAVGAGVEVVAYVSAAFGFVPRGADAAVTVTPRRVSELVRTLAELGAKSVTLSDLQGLAGPAETEDLLSELISGSAPSSVPIGYHPHHTSVEAGLANVEAAARAGVRLFDASLGAVGGCVTGAPGNAPTEGVASMLAGLGLETGLDWARLESLAGEVESRIYGPMSERSEP